MIASLGLLRERGPAKRNRHRGHQPTAQALGDVLHRAESSRAVPDSMRARAAASRSSRSSLAMAFSGIRSGCPVPKTKRSEPTVWSSVARWSSGGPQTQVMSQWIRAASSGV